MKRSEANIILKNRIEFSTQFDCFAILRSCQCEYYHGIEVPPMCSEDCQCEDMEPYFSHRGCDCCTPGLGNSVVDVKCFPRDQIKKRDFDDYYTFQLCGGCLCSLINGDNSDLDYHVTEKDTFEWSSNFCTQLIVRDKIAAYLENECNFRDYYFHSATKYHSIHLPATMHLLQPSENDLNDACSVFSRDGYQSIHIYI